ncbi:mechanosensitive ion channel family protein [archaeon]|jgi:MscS family membrane protein|nr:mechanosensitive ion channel family protein [archaeon]
MVSNVTGLATANVTEKVPVILRNIESYLGFIHFQNVYYNAIAVFFVFIAIAFVVRFIFTKFLYKLVKGTKTDIDDIIIDTAKGPILFLIIILGIFFSARILKIDNLMFNHSFYTIMSFLIFWLFFKVILITIHGLREGIGKKSVKLFDNKVFPFFERGLKLFLGVIYLFVIFKIWKIDITPLLAGAGVAGLAMAFAAQDTISNVFGGLSLFGDKAYEIGDFIIVDDQHRGEVMDIGLRSTKLRTRDDVLIVVPNSIMANSKVINESGIHPKLRVRIDIDVAYGSDLDKVEKVLMKLADESDYVEKKPEPRIRFRAFKDFSVGLQLLFWIKKPVYKGRFTSNMIKDIHKTFFKENIEFPFPTQDVYIKHMPKPK